jgi:hypothetical protein
MQWVWDAMLLTLEILVEGQCAAYAQSTYAADTVAVSLVLRVFAMYGLNVWVLVCLMPATCAVVSLGLVNHSNYALYDDPDFMHLVVIHHVCATHGDCCSSGTGWMPCGI